MKHFNQLVFLLLLAVNGFCFAQTLLVDGYMDKKSYAPGDTALVYLNTSVADSAYKCWLFDVLGNKVDSVMTTVFPQVVTNVNPYKNGFGYSKTFSYIIPTYLKSGIYSWKKEVLFIVKSRQKKHQVVVLYETNTREAYNRQGGKSLYDYNSTGGRSHTVSFLRPMFGSVVSTYSREFMEWLATFHPCEVGYIGDMDMDDYSEIEQAKLLVLTGHSEYWTREARVNFDRFLAAGKNVLILAGNTMWWHARYSPDKLQLVCYKDSVLDPETDPLNETIQWSDSSLQYPILTSTGCDYAHGGRGDDSSQAMTGWQGYKIANATLPFFINTGLIRGDTIFCGSHEYDGTMVNGFDLDSFPVIDSAALGFKKVDLAGFDIAQGTPPIFGTWISFQKNDSSGRVINVASTNWTSKTGIGGPDSALIRIITRNMINQMMDDTAWLVPMPGFSVCENYAVCQGDSVTLYATGGVSFLWSTGSTASAITVSPPMPTTYMVIVTDVYGNANTVPVVVNVHIPPAQPAVLNNFNILTCSTVSDHYQWYCNGLSLAGTDSFSITCSLSGDYQVEVIDSNGCRALSPPLFVSCSIGIPVPGEYGMPLVFIAPNPVAQQADIRMVNPGQPLQFELTDRLGRLVRQFQVTYPGMVFKKENLGADIYFYRLFRNNQFLGMGKLAIIN